MFLKQDTFNYGDQSVVMTELSGLQRVEYLSFVQKRTAEFDALDDAMPVA
ncbi:phage minor tail protein G, partial [Escherichia coli]|nr:phage minor tail protein G [Escherichia coli]